MFKIKLASKQIIHYKKAIVKKFPLRNIYFNFS